MPSAPGPRHTVTITEKSSSSSNSFHLLFMLELCLSKNAKLCQLKDPLFFGLAVLVGGIASPSLYVVMLAGDGITLAARV